MSYNSGKAMRPMPHFGSAAQVQAHVRGFASDERFRVGGR